MIPKQTFVDLVGTHQEDIQRPKRVFRIKNNTIVEVEKEHEEEPPNTYILKSAAPLLAQFKQKTGMETYPFYRHSYGNCRLPQSPRCGMYIKSPTQVNGESF